MKGASIKIALLLMLMVVVHVWLAYFTLRAQTMQLFSLFAVLFLLYYLLCQTAAAAKQLSWLLIGGIALRAIWVFAFPQLSDDWARFVWDGRLLAAGYNPFNHLPSELMKGGLPGSEVADASLFHAMNSPEYFTVYPPLLQSMFAAAAWLFPHNVSANIIVLKTFILLAECGSIALLVRLCDSWKLPSSRSLLYALNPLVIAELTGNVHHEGVVIFFLLATLYALQKERFWLAVLLFTGAAVTKLLPLIFLPLMLAYFGWRRGLLFCASVLTLFAVCWLPFVNGGLFHHATASVGLYFNLFEFNASIYYVVRDIVFYFTNEIRIESIAPALGGLGTTAILLYAFIKRKALFMADLPKAFLITLSVYLAFTTMVHPWYIAPLIALSVFTPLRFPLVWSAMIVTSYYEYHTQPETESAVQLWVEYSVVAAAVVWDVWQMRKSAFTAKLNHDGRG